MESKENNLDILIPSQVKEPLFWKGYLFGAVIALFFATPISTTAFLVFQNIVQNL